MIQYGEASMRKATRRGHWDFDEAFEHELFFFERSVERERGRGPARTRRNPHTKPHTARVFPTARHRAGTVLLRRLWLSLRCIAVRVKPHFHSSRGAENSSGVTRA